MELAQVRPEDKALLWRLLQQYLHEMNRYYDDPTDSDGSLPYPYFDAYFTDPRRRAFFLRAGETTVGFALIHPYSHNGGADYVLAEFTVLPPYRQNRLARTAAHTLFTAFPGRWELKYHHRNRAAKALWQAATAPYAPAAARLNDTETLLSFSTR